MMTKINWRNQNLRSYAVVVVFLYKRTTLIGRMGWSDGWMYEWRSSSSSVHFYDIFSEFNELAVIIFSYIMKLV